ncbi:aldo/keto reductase [Streptomyces lydicamycinicus]|uniref:aldo/keto reductase n=1 Tax=Streptomyces lydicamycinicus TaxID=1546107 RepID=UPI00099C099F|nr:aldo/keto reductase [Streptomyces lydicamycinicus]
MRTADGRIVLGLHRSGHARDLLEAAADLGIGRIDTASNYLRHRSHEVLKTTAGDLLANFSVSTKVGFFPEGHSLDPARLQIAVEQVAKDLGREPDLVFLHNPEHSASDTGRLGPACAALAHTARAGLCGSWGVSTWDPAVAWAGIAGCLIAREGRQELRVLRVRGHSYGRGRRPVRDAAVDASIMTQMSPHVVPAPWRQLCRDRHRLRKHQGPGRLPSHRHAPAGHHRQNGTHPCVFIGQSAAWSCHLPYACGSSPTPLS